VVINLIMNALQSLPDRDRAVCVETAFDEHAREAVIRVRDEGTGMPDEVKNRLFEPFFSTKLESGGTGLGLAISNVIVKDHRGVLEFVSEPGRGTTAIVRLPVE
jgi:signal transduction histidine kinase